jgi:hypothetical protein
MEWAMPEDIKTEGNLLRRLSQASKFHTTRDQLRRQRVSFIFGALPKNSTITRQQIENVLDKVEGETA